jgi:membrane protease YdiL (CAAX protease family)
MRQERSDDGRTFHPVVAVAVTALGIAAMLLGGRAVAAGGLGLRGTVAVGTLLLGAPALLALLAQPQARRPALGLALDRRTAALSLLLAAALWVGSIGIIELQALVRPPSPEELDVFRRLHAALAPRSALDAVLSVAVIAVLPALCEELVMRGVLLSSLAARLGPAAGVGIAAAVFAVIHDPLRLLFAFTLGIVFGVVRLRTASLWPSVLAHATLNTLTFLVVGAALAGPLLRALRSRATIAPDVA